MEILIMVGLVYVVYWFMRASADTKKWNDPVDPPVQDTSAYRAREHETDVNEYGEIDDRYR
jgi:hypothetical protein